MEIAAQLGVWFAAPEGLPTPGDRVRMIVRILAAGTSIAGASVAEVVVYAHGTAVIRVEGATRSADDLMAAYDVPHDGEGGPFGDIDPVPFDDGSVLYGWPAIGTDGCAISTMTSAEMETADPPVSPTERFQTDSPAQIYLLRAGLAARHRRTLDARQRQRVAWWKAPLPS